MVIVTTTLQERCEYFELLPLGEELEVTQPFGEWLLSDHDRSIRIASFTLSELERVIVTASYYGDRDRAIADELMWRIGAHPSVRNRYLRKVGDANYTIHWTSYRRYSAQYRNRTTPTFKVRYDIEPIELRDALFYYFPKEFVGVERGIRSVPRLDSLAIAYWGNLRLLRWYISRNRPIGASFAQNTVNLECLRFASESGAPITRRPIHTSSEECREYLLAAGAVDYPGRCGDIASRFYVPSRPSCFKVAIARGDLDAMKRIWEATIGATASMGAATASSGAATASSSNEQPIYDPIGADHFHLASRSDPEITLALAQWCEREALSNHLYSIVKQAKIEGIKLLIAAGIDKESVVAAATMAGSEALLYLHRLGVSYSNRDLNALLVYCDLLTIKTLTEVGYMWTPFSLIFFAAMGEVEKLKYLLEIVEFPIALLTNIMSTREEGIFKTFHLAGYPAAQRGGLPPRTANICKAVIDYIHKEVDPDY